MIIVYAIFAYICISVASMILFVIIGEEANGDVVLGGILWPISLLLFILYQLYYLCIKMLKVVKSEVKGESDKYNSQLIPSEAIIKNGKVIIRIRIRDVKDLPDSSYGIYPVIYYNKNKGEYCITTEFYKDGVFKRFYDYEDICKWLDVKILDQ